MMMYRLIIYCYMCLLNKKKCEGKNTKRIEVFPSPIAGVLTQFEMIYGRTYVIPQLKPFT